MTVSQQSQEVGSGMYLPPLSPYAGMDTFRLMVSEWWEEFGIAFAEYGPGAADETGLAGQWADLYRKVRKLKRGMWDREGFAYLTRESAEEILKDIISHAFLAWDQYNRSIEPSPTSAESPSGLSPTLVNPEAVPKLSLG